MGQSDLGIVRDIITRVEKISGTGAAGTIDTYGVFTESHPYNGGAGTPLSTFGVRNGANGESTDFAAQDYTSLSDLKTWLATNAPSVASMILIDTSNPSKTVTQTVVFLFDSAMSVAQKFFVYNGSSWNEVSSLGTGETIRVYYYSVTGAVSYPQTALRFSAGMTYSSDPDLVAAVADGKPFLDDSGYIYYLTGINGDYREYMSLASIPGSPNSRIVINEVFFDTSDTTVTGVSTLDPIDYIRNDISADYSSVKPYSKGDLCTRNGYLYRALQDITAEAWTAAHWESVDIETLLKEKITFGEGVRDGTLWAGKADYADEAGNLKTTYGVELKAGQTVNGALDEPFGFRPTAFPFGRDVITIGGKKATVQVARAYGFVKNQLAKDINSENWSSTNATVSFSDGVATFTASEQNGSVSTLVDLKQGHKYIVSVTIKNTTASEKTYLRLAGVNLVSSGTSTSFQTLFAIYERTGANTNAGLVIRDERDSDWDAIQVKDARVIDLNQWFNSDSTILSKTSESWFVPWFLNNFGAKIPSTFNDGQVEFGWAKKIKTVGVNVWNEQWEEGSINNDTGAFNNVSGYIRTKEHIRVIPGESYYFKSASLMRTFFYDKDKNLIGTYSLLQNEVFTIPVNCFYIAFRSNSTQSSYNNDIQICFHWTDTSIETACHAHEEWLFEMDWDFAGADGPMGVNSLCGDEKDFVAKKNRKVVKGYTFTGTETTSTGGSGDGAYLAVTMSNYVSDAVDYQTNVDSKDLMMAPYTTINRYTINAGNAKPGCVGIVQTSASWWQLRVYGATSISDFTGKTLYYRIKAPTETDMTEVEASANSYFCNDYGSEQVLDADGNQTVCSFDILYQNDLARQIVNNQDAISTLNGRVPTAPMSDGNYTLKVTVSGGTPTFSWVAESE